MRQRRPFVIASSWSVGGSSGSSKGGGVMIPEFITKAAFGPTRQYPKATKSTRSSSSSSSGRNLTSTSSLSNVITFPNAPTLFHNTYLRNRTVVSHSHSSQQSSSLSSSSSSSSTLAMTAATAAVAAAVSFLWWSSIIIPQQQQKQKLQELERYRKLWSTNNNNNNHTTTTPVEVLWPRRYIPSPQDIKALEFDFTFCPKQCNYHHHHPVEKKEEKEKDASSLQQQHQSQRYCDNLQFRIAAYYLYPDDSTIVHTNHNQNDKNNDKNNDNDNKYHHSTNHGNHQEHETNNHLVNPTNHHQKKNPYQSISAIEMKRGYHLLKDLAHRGHADGMCLYGKILQEGRTWGSATTKTNHTTTTAPPPPAVVVVSNNSNHNNHHGNDQHYHQYPSPSAVILSSSLSSSSSSSTSLVDDQCSSSSSSSGTDDDDDSSIGLDGIDANPNDAVVWWRRAIDLHAPYHHLPTLYELGVALYTGDGVPEDAKLALEYFHRSAEQGHVGAAYMLADAYLHGVGISTPNPMEAWKCLVYAAEFGHRRAQHRVLAVLESMTMSGSSSSVSGSSNQRHTNHSNNNNHSPPLHDDDDEEFKKMLDQWYQNRQGSRHDRRLKPPSTVSIERRFTIGGGSRNPVISARRKRVVEESRNG